MRCSILKESAKVVQVQGMHEFISIDDNNDDDDDVFGTAPAAPAQGDVPSQTDVPV